VGADLFFEKTTVLRKIPPGDHCTIPWRHGDVPSWTCNCLKSYWISKGFALWPPRRLFRHIVQRSQPVPVAAPIKTTESVFF